MAKAKQVAAAAAEEVKKVWVEILSPVLHDGEKMLVGAVHEIEELAAAALVKLGLAKPSAEPAEAEEPKQ